jgi:outer membrane protein assembly factor BamB
VKTAVTAVLLLALAGLSCDGLFGPRYGETVWTYDPYPERSFFFNGSVNTTPTMAGGTIYVGETGYWFWIFPMMSGSWGGVHSVTDAGARNWRLETPQPVFGLAILPDGRIVYCAGDSVCAMNTDGTGGWVYSPNAPSITQPALATDGTVYFGAHDSGFFALNPDGSERWRFLASVSTTQPPMVGPDGTVYFVGGDGAVQALAADGHPLWRRSTLAHWTRLLALGSDGAPLVSYSDSSLRALGTDGSVRWTAHLPDQAGAGVVDADGNVYVGLAESDSLFALGPDGSPRWTRDSEWAVRSLVLGNDSSLYYCDDDRLYCLDLDGSQRWRSEAEQFAAALTILPGGTLVLMENGKLRGVTTASQGLAAAPWPCARHDLANTGRQ